MRQALAEGVFPGAVLLVSRAEKFVFHEAYGHANIFSGRRMSVDTVFDLASLTKPLATTLAIMALIEKRQLGLDLTLGDIWPSWQSSDKAGIRIDQLLAHVAGMPSYRPYYSELCRIPRSDRPKALLERMLQEPLQYLPGEQTCYSDPGFMLLSLVIEKIAACGLDLFVTRNIYQPLGINDLFFVDIHRDKAHRGCAATAYCRWRRQLVEGFVHDENAFALGGIAGHAGLFGTAEAVAHLLAGLLQSLASPHGLFPSTLMKQFFSRFGGTERALGFDMPAAEGSSAGSLVDPDATVGHLGFTGTSFWIALDRSLAIVLLTNRIHPSAANEGIKIFRPRLHDCVMACF